MATILVGQGFLRGGLLWTGSGIIVSAVIGSRVPALRRSKI
jgi:hypothetical protein